MKEKFRTKHMCQCCLGKSFSDQVLIPSQSRNHLNVEQVELGTLKFSQMAVLYQVQPRHPNRQWL